MIYIAVGVLELVCYYRVQRTIGFQLWLIIILRLKASSYSYILLAGHIKSSNVNNEQSTSLQYNSVIAIYYKLSSWSTIPHCGQYTTRKPGQKTRVPRKPWDIFAVNCLPREICETFWALLILIGSKDILDPRFVIEWHARCSAWGISGEIFLEWHSRGTVQFHVSCTVRSL